jgi:hypothetical protein
MTAGIQKTDRHLGRRSFSLASSVKVQQILIEDQFEDLLVHLFFENEKRGPQF